MQPEGDFYLITASWVFSESGWLEGGAIIFDPEKGEAICAGDRRDLKRSWGIQSAKIRDYPGCALFPALVNGHTHLELSAHSLIEADDYFTWVRRLIRLRSQLPMDQVVEAFRRELRKVWQCGTCLVGDITNIPILKEEEGEKLPYRHVFWELLGFNVYDIYDALKEDQRRYFLDGRFTRHISLVPHAVYSTSSRLISQTYRWCRSRGRPFTIHIGEHPDEREFMLTGKGACRELLEELGRWVPGWEPPGVSPVKYLESRKVLDSKTLLIHCIHFDDNDWQIVRSHGSHLCFCLRSNEFLKVGRPDIVKAYELGIPVLFGTDSLASSPDLNMFREIASVIDCYRDLHPDGVLKSASFTAFRFFTGNTRMPYLLVSPEGSASRDTITETVIESGVKGKIRWLEEDFVLEE
ncbi:amidohydrolase family protein [Thermodesulforhabdus norvegica]|uniref:Cytosine/adenosine deaminase n=1 Tax=Thermodesulforhabdus norvegica TaxID=39841 RepID=A0A1I4UMA4_9BACT|nr:amidohydrolase family protein [Thermodesulforhabdus norvegica]SFM90124.1 Cytosine/adenosine deaminase [Thermodesulforhabdus norvegica]